MFWDGNLFFYVEDRLGKCSPDLSSGRPKLGGPKRSGVQGAVGVPDSPAEFEKFAISGSKIMLGTGFGPKNK